ncbi:MAG: hypothetical protein CMC63_03180 [Flavobacteriaceae bacterium]|nr:hypothetical protein [Flavobacteriaceae bacterium]
MKKILLPITLSIIIFSCGNNNNLKDNSSPEIYGFWNRLGTIRYVNNIPVDTSLIKNSKNPWFKQIKVYKDGNVIWINNARDTLTPWKGGSGGYGKIKIHSSDSLTEMISNGTGSWGTYVKNNKDSLDIPYMTFGISADIKGNAYNQKWGNNFEQSEYWGRMEKLQGKTKFDGAWKRVYQINFVNGIAVDTTSVPSDAVLDAKIFSDGYYTYQVDQTGLADPEKPEYGGYGGYGTFEYNEEKNILTEYQEWGSGGQVGSSPPKSNPIYHDIKFYNDDLFLQIGIDSLEGNQAGRGLVYKRIK